MAVLIISLAVGGVVLVGLLTLVGTVATAYYCRKPGRENNCRHDDLDGPEDKRGEAARHSGAATTPTHRSGAGASELTRRGRNGKRVEYNERGGEEREMEALIFSPPALECHCPVPADTPQVGRAENGDLTQRLNEPSRRPSTPAASSTRSGYERWNDGACGGNQHAEQPPSQALPRSRELDGAFEDRRRRSETRQLRGAMRPTHSQGAGELTHRSRNGRRRRGRELEDSEDKRGEARQLGKAKSPTHSSGASELTRLGRNGRELVQYNAPLIPADTPQAGCAVGGEVTHRLNSRRVGHNKRSHPISSPARPSSAEPSMQSGCGRVKDGACGSLRTSLTPQSCPCDTLTALDHVQKDPTLEIRTISGGNETTRQQHFDRLERYLKDCKKDGALIWFPGHGQPGTGDWVFLDGVITFADVFGLYQNYFMGRKLTIICDCCYSGHWVEKLAMILDEYGIPPCGHRAKALDIKLQIVASCQKDQQCHEKAFNEKALHINEDGSIKFPRKMELFDNQTTTYIDTTEIRCSSGVYGTCSISPRKKWKTT